MVYTAGSGLVLTQFCTNYLNRIFVLTIQCKLSFPLFVDNHQVRRCLFVSFDKQLKLSKIREYIFFLLVLVPRFYSPA